MYDWEYSIYKMGFYLTMNEMHILSTASLVLLDIAPCFPHMIMVNYPFIWPVLMVDDQAIKVTIATHDFNIVKQYVKHILYRSGWCFRNVSNMNFIFPYIRNNNPNWLIFFQRGWNDQPAIYTYTHNILRPFRLPSKRIPYDVYIRPSWNG